MKRNILLADNDADVRKKWGELLQNAGYVVHLASTPQESRVELESGEIDLAVIDARLVVENLESDISGLELARDIAFRHIPKIILTGHVIPYEAQRKVDAPIEYVGKAEGYKALLQVLEQTFSKEMNENLEVRLVDRTSLNSWTVHILSIPWEKERIEELCKLFQKLFKDFEQVEVKRGVVLRQSPRQILAQVKLKRDRIYEHRLLKCGQRNMVEEEQQAFRDGSRGRLVEPWSVVLEHAKISTNLGAISYSARGFDLVDAMWLAEFYRHRTIEETKAVLDRLFDLAGQYLYSQPCPPESTKSIRQLYRERLGLAGDHQAQANFQKNIEKVTSHIRKAYNTRVSHDTTLKQITFSHVDQPPLSCPDPIPFIFDEDEKSKHPVLCHLSLGFEDGYNILVDKDGRTWVSDFGSIGAVPALYDFVALESRIRFDWLHTVDLTWEQLVKLETRLCQSGSFEEPALNTSLEDKELDKTLAVIFHLRQLAAKFPGADALDYQWGLLFQAVAVLTISVDDDLEDSRLRTRQAHAFLGAALICKNLE